MGIWNIVEWVVWGSGKGNIVFTGACVWDLKHCEAEWVAWASEIKNSVLSPLEYAWETSAASEIMKRCVVYTSRGTSDEGMQLETSECILGIAVA